LEATPINKKEGRILVDIGTEQYHLPASYSHKQQDRFLPFTLTHSTAFSSSSQMYDDDSSGNYLSISFASLGERWEN